MANLICDYVSQFRPLGDRILLRPLPWKPSNTIDVVRYGRTLRGEVMAIGKGHNPLKYKTRGDKTKTMDYSKHFRPVDVKVGDIVELGGLNVFDGQGYQFPEVIVGTETMLVCSERDVAGIVESEREQLKERVESAPSDVAGVGVAVSATSLRKARGRDS